MYESRRRGRGFQAVSVNIGEFRTLAQPPIIPDSYVDRLPFYRGEDDVCLSDDSYERTPTVPSGAPTCNFRMIL